jgi:hypothetical protein
LQAQLQRLQEELAQARGAADDAYGQLARANAALAAAGPGPSAPAAAGPTAAGSAASAAAPASLAALSGLSMEEKVDTLQKEATRLRTQLQKARDDLGDVQNALMLEKRATEAQAAKVRAAEDAAARAAAATEEAKAQAAKAEREVRTTAANLRTSELENEKLGRRAREAEERLQFATAAAERARTETQAAREDEGRVRAALQARTAELERAQSEVTQARDGVRQLQAECRRLADELGAAQMRCAVLGKEAADARTAAQRNAAAAAAGEPYAMHPPPAPPAPQNGYPQRRERQPVIGYGGPGGYMADDTSGVGSAFNHGAQGPPPALSHGRTGRRASFADQPAAAFNEAPNMRPTSPTRFSAAQDARRSAAATGGVADIFGGSAAPSSRGPTRDEQRRAAVHHMPWQQEQQAQTADGVPPMGDRRRSTGGPLVREPEPGTRPAFDQQGGRSQNRPTVHDQSNHDESYRTAPASHGIRGPVFDSASTVSSVHVPTAPQFVFPQPPARELHPGGASSSNHAQQHDNNGLDDGEDWNRVNRQGNVSATGEDADSVALEEALEAARVKRNQFTAWRNVDRTGDMGRPSQAAVVAKIASATMNPYGPAHGIGPGLNSQSIAKANALVSERVRRETMLMDIVEQDNQRKQGTVYRRGAPESSLDSQNNGSSMPSPPRPGRRPGPGMTTGGSGHAPGPYGPSAAHPPPSLAANITSQAVEDAVPLSSAAAKRIEEEEARTRETSRLSRVQAIVSAHNREAGAPFATEAGALDSEASIADKEQALLSRNQEKANVEAELKRMGPAAPRTLRDRQRKEELANRLNVLEKELSSLRIWFKHNGVQ